jgi:RNA polymerase sigma factor (TIGR02999 family)
VASEHEIQPLIERISRWFGKSMTARPNVAEDSLAALLRGESVGVDRLFELLYTDLRERADRLLQSDRKGKSLAPTELVHEAWLKFVRLDHLRLNGRQHFLAVAAIAMKQVLIDRARARLTLKRASGPKVELNSELPGGSPVAVDLLDFEDAMADLNGRFPEQATIAAMHLTGMTLREIADHQGSSFDSIRDQWRFARAYLNRRLGEEDA